MVLNAYDVKFCVWKMIKISTKTCVNVTKKHPYFTSCLFFLFLIYMCCPLFFWILIYSLPAAVSMWVVFHIRDGRRCKEEREKESEQKERESGEKMVKKTMIVEEGKGKERIKKAYLRVHSVRRRKAKEIERGDDPYTTAKRKTGDVEAEDEDEDDEEYNLTDPDKDAVDKKALVEESPKEIREVHVDSSQASANDGAGISTGAGAGADISISSEIYRNPEVVRSLRLLKDEEDVRDEAGKTMDVNIAEAETNKRLESLIARRRSKKVVSQVKRSLMTNDATKGGIAQMPSIVIPKVNTWCSPSRSIAPFSPGPGSAPSMLGPTRNPFDLPYDPHEEKPDLTGDSFQQEFASGHNRDFTFCRHESFSLGPSLPMDFFEDRDDASSIDDFGFRRPQSSVGYQYPRPETEESDMDIGATTEAESGHESDSGPDSKSNLDSLDSDHPDHDQIKEVIQVHENGVDNPSVEGRAGEPNTRPNALDELSLSEASTGSSDDDRPPVCKINREVILKSLSMRRNSVSIPDLEMESNDHLQENNLSYANSALENASRLKQQYFADKPQKRHGMTFSIASDMQVEVSELSSPPLTIGENMSYQDDGSAYDGEMERNASWDGLDSWAGSSRLSEAEDNETRPSRASEIGATRTRKFDDLTPPSASAAGSQATGLSDKIIAQTTSPESSSGEEQSPAAVEDAAKASSTAATTQNVVSNEPAQRVETGTTTPAAMDSVNTPQERLHHPTISPKSVLQPTLSVASFENEDHDEVHLSGPRPASHSSSNAPPNSIASGVQFTVGTISNGAAESSQQKIQANDQKLKQVLDDSASETAHTRHESGSSTSLSSDVDSSDMDYMNEESKIQESNAFEAANTSNRIDKGKRVIQESTHEPDTETSSEDYDSEVEERGDLHEVGAK